MDTVKNVVYMLAMIGALFLFMAAIGSEPCSMYSPDQACIDQYHPER